MHSLASALVFISVLCLGYSFVRKDSFQRFLPAGIRSSHPLQMSSDNGILSSRAESMFKSILDGDAQTGGAGGSSSLEGLYNLDKVWSQLRNGGWKETPKQVVFPQIGPSTSNTIDYDVIISGGTLGIFYAYALQLAGFTTCVVERGIVAGRPQEWNISRKELEILVILGLLTQEEVESIVGIEFNPVRAGFKTDTSPESTAPGFEVFVNDILNLGIKPDRLIALIKDKYISSGGILLEKSTLSKIEIFENKAEMSIVSAGSTSAGSSNSQELKLSSRLIIDAMGNGSPIVKQIRGPVEPDGICIVVGSCARGYDPKNNTYSDVIYTDTPVTKKNSSALQYFWEAFPAGSSIEDRTTYLFTYMDAKPERPSILEIVEDYCELLPRYQGYSVQDLKFIRFLYGFFPTYRSSPVREGTFDRILQVGDASGIQSPLSFGGFGSLTRHIGRITCSVKDALGHDLVSAEYLSMINPYQPNLSACWMFQRAMSVPVGRDPRPDIVTGTLSNSFSSMERLGDVVMRPFLQDVLQFVPLLRTLGLAAVQDPLTPFKIVPHVGLVAMGDFFVHFFNMAVYTLLANTIGPVVTENSSKFPRETKFRLLRLAEAWKFGSGLDYYDH